MRTISLAVLAACSLLLQPGCGGGSSDDTTTPPGGDAANVADAAEAPDGTDTTGATDTGGPTQGVVQVVLFTHIEDNTPAGELGSEQSRKAYLALRGKLVEVAELAKSYDLAWVLQPDWKYLEAAKLYEDATARAATGGKNVFRYLHDDLGVPIDPHSHENGGYNYADIAYLLTGLGVGGSTVIGGHIWDPALPQFQEWDRFRVALAGEHYPEASWRGDILIGAGTPNHVNDPTVSGIWRPKDRDHYFTDDPDGNIVSVGAWTKSVAGVAELVALHENGVVPPDQILTSSWNIVPSTLTKPTGLAEIEETVLKPLAALRDQGKVAVTDFTTLVALWKGAYGGKASIYQP